MEKDLRNLLKIPSDRLDAINAVLLDPNEQVINDFLKVVAKYGTPEEINKKHAESRQLSNLMKLVKARNPDYIQDLEWLIEQRDRGAFISVAAYRERLLGQKFKNMRFNEASPVTLEVSALQYFPWVRPMCEQAIQEGSLVPGRFIAVRKMKNPKPMATCLP